MGAIVKIEGENITVVVDTRNQNEIKSKRVAQKTLDGATIEIFNSISEAERITGIRHIGECANGCLYRKSAGGYRW